MKLSPELYFLIRSPKGHFSTKLRGGGMPTLNVVGGYRTDSTRLWLGKPQKNKSSFFRGPATKRGGGGGGGTTKGTKKIFLEPKKIKTKN